MVKSTIFVKTSGPGEIHHRAGAGRSRLGAAPMKPRSGARSRGRGMERCTKTFRRYDAALLHEIMTIKYSD